MTRRDAATPAPGPAHDDTRGTPAVEAKRARQRLACAADAGDPAVADLVERHGPVDALAAVADGALGAQLVQRLGQMPADRVEELAARARARFVVPGEREWPTGLADLGHAGSVHRRGGPPLGLWLRGPGDLDGWSRRSVAVVGSRAASSYGAGIAADLGAELAEQGVAVISGGAFGIDAAAHRGALAVGGPTIGVVANGVDVAYPQGNSALFDRLASDQLLVSELPPGSHPTRIRFLARNRLIAALSSGTVVVEAALRSGARNTAGWASACGRPVMAVPGPLTSRGSAGPHLMIRSGQAVLVGGVADVIELISPVGYGIAPVQHGPRAATDGLDDVELAVYEAASARERRSAAELAIDASVSVPACLAALGRLESAGLVDGNATGWLALVAGARIP